MPDITWSKSLPTMVLYEGQGLSLYEDITNYTHYYLYNDELSILRQHGNEIAAHLLNPAPRGNTNVYANEGETETTNLYTTIIDLGAGPLKKVTYLLDSLATLARESQSRKEPSVWVTYCALDIQIQQLRRRLSDLLRKHPHFINGSHEVNRHDGSGKIAVRGICGSYNDAIELLKGSNSNAELKMQFQRLVGQGKSLLWLGSSFTNVPPPSAAKFLRRFVTNDILQVGDKFLIGIDRCQDVDRIKAAYWQGAECWRAYVRNGVKTAGMILGVDDAMSQLDGGSDWEYVARWDANEGKHVRFVRSAKSIRFSVPLSTEPFPFVKEINIDAGEHIFLAQSYKYSTTDVEQCFQLAGLDIMKEWSDDENYCSLYLLEKNDSDI